MKYTFVALLVGLSFQLQAQQIEPSESLVSFELSNMLINTVEGTFTGMAGEINYDVDRPSSATFSVCVDASTVNTGSKKRDQHLREEDFFSVEEFPTICINSTRIQSTPEGLRFFGTLNMHGVVKEVEFPFTYAEGKFKGSFTINRLDYGLGEGTGSFAVGEEVEISIECSVNG